MVFLPITIRDTAGNPVANKVFWLDRKRAPGGSNIPEYSGKYTTDENGTIMNQFNWDGDVPVSATISITPLFASADAPANRAIVWQQPATWYGPGSEITNTLVTLRPGGKSDVPSPTPAAAPSPSGSPSSAPSAPGGTPTASEEIDYWTYATWGAVGLVVLAVTYFYVLPAVFGKEGDK
jgi:hypothetical protein